MALLYIIPIFYGEPYPDKTGQGLDRPSDFGTQSQRRSLFCAPAFGQHIVCERGAIRGPTGALVAAHLT